MKRNTLKIVVVIGIILILGMLVYKYAHYRNAIFAYDVKMDYKYDIPKSNTLEIPLQNWKLKIPDSIDKDCSAFLKLKIQSTFLGKWLQPSLEIKSKKYTAKEYFEDGAEGNRYLNITQFAEIGSKELKITGHRLTIEDQMVELSFFKKKDLAKAKILVIGTHPDDAEIAAYGLYSKFPDSFVLNIKSGESGEFKYDEVYTDTVKHYQKKGQLRTWNSITIPLLGGLKPENILNFGYFTDLREMYQKDPENLSSEFAKTSDINTYRKQNISGLKDSLTGTANWNSLVQNFKFILLKLQPDVIVTPYPALDRHHDHQYTTIALFEALKMANIQNGDLFLYSNHYILNEHYPYGKPGSSITLPPNFNNDIYFEGVYSNTLNSDFQKDKLFALEAMHDLRPDTEWRYGIKAVKNALSTAKTELLGGDNSYFKRAVRSNELFFTIPVEKIYDSTIVEKIISGNNKNGFTNSVYKNEN